MPAGGGMTSARTLREPLEHFYREFDYTARVEFDAIRFPLRYADPRDRELVGLLAACLAYGRVDLFGRQLDGVLAVMGPSPARTIGPALASMLIYLLMAVVLYFRPTGLFPVKGR